MGYLVISRRTNERLTIGNNIEILISYIGRDRVDLAIKAPKDIQIKRQRTQLEEEKSGVTIRDKSRQRYKRD